MRRDWSLRLVMVGVAALLSAQECGGSGGPGPGTGGFAAAGGTLGAAGMGGRAGTPGAGGEAGVGGAGDRAATGGAGGEPGTGGSSGCFDGGPIAVDVIDVDCNAYDTVVIGEQRWFRTNLKTTRYRDTTPIRTGLSGPAWAGTDEGAYAIYDDDPLNDELYGKLYNWHAVNNPSGLCPEGWRVPTPADVAQLRLFMGYEANDGGKMKSTSGWEAPNTGATNSTGFDAKPGGVRGFTNGNFGDAGRRASFWTSRASANGGGVTFAFHFSFFYESDEFIDGARSMENGYSVRCIEEE